VQSHTIIHPFCLNNPMPAWRQTWDGKGPHRNPCSGFWCHLQR
jgi:hypothetical protein